MAFYIYAVDGGAIPSWEYHPCSAITPEVGMAMTQTSGNLATASGSTVPTYICMTQRGEAVTAGDIIPVIRVSESIIFETTFSASASSVTVGSRVTIASGGMKVTGTTASGVAEVVAMEGTAAGSRVWVRFPAAKTASA